MMKKIISILLVIILVLSLTACGSSSDSDTVEIEFSTWWTTEIDKEYYLELIAEFEELNPGVTVTLTELPFAEVRTQAMTNDITGTIADVLAMNPPWAREFYDLGMLAPLDDYIANDASYDLNNYAGVAEEIEGSQYTVPYDSLAFMLYYNIDMFEEAGLDLPTNWEELRECAAALTDADNDEYGFTMVLSETAAANGSILSLYPLLYAANGRTYVDGEWTVETDEMEAALQLIYDMQEDGSILPGTTSKTEQQISEEFANNNIGMMIQSNAHIATVDNRNPDLNYGVMAIPSQYGTTEPELRHHGWDLGVAAKSENPDVAWDFVVFLTSKENMQSLGEENLKIPAYIDLDKSYMDANPVLVQAAEIMENYEMVEELATMPSVGTCWTELTRVGSAVLSGTMTPAQALTECQATWDEILG